jgi:hypothetical protein
LLGDVTVGMGIKERLRLEQDQEIRPVGDASLEARVLGGRFRAKGLLLLYGSQKAKPALPFFALGHKILFKVRKWFLSNRR